MAEPAAAGAVAEKLRIAVAAPYSIDGNTIHTTASLGIAPLGPDIPEADAMLAQADLALYRAKEEGRDQYRFHSQDLDEHVRERVSITTDLRQALDRNELELYYQPQIDLVTGAIAGMEALALWHHPTRGLVMPSDFIPIAEKTGTILPLGRWILDQACSQMRLWQDADVAPPVVAINVSILQLKSGPEFVQNVLGALARWKLAARSLELDVTESALAQVSWARNDVLSQLTRIGVKIALDDFGSDLSLFDYLTKYHVNRVKIARQFTDMATQDAGCMQIIRAMVNLARNLQIGVIAKGIETTEQRSLLTSIGSPAVVQGFYFGKPVNASQALELLRSGTILRSQKPAA
jgi:EAL domain-containing protein (putative c-di-GMP-specific phosphodiesterase class I)